MDKKIGLAIAVLVGALLAAVLWSDLFESRSAPETVARPAISPAARPVPPATVVRSPAPVPIVRTPPSDERSDRPGEVREVTTQGPDGTTIVVTSDGTVVTTTATRTPDGAN